MSADADSSELVVTASLRQVQLGVSGGSTRGSSHAQGCRSVVRDVAAGRRSVCSAAVPAGAAASRPARAFPATVTFTPRVADLASKATVNHDGQDRRQPHGLQRAAASSGSRDVDDEATRHGELHDLRPTGRAAIQAGDADTIVMDDKEDVDRDEHAEALRSGELLASRRCRARSRPGSSRGTTRRRP